MQSDVTQQVNNPVVDNTVNTNDVQLANENVALDNVVEASAADVVELTQQTEEQAQQPISQDAVLDYFKQLNTYIDEALSMVSPETLAQAKQLIAQEAGIVEAAPVQSSEVRPSEDVSVQAEKSPDNKTYEELARLKINDMEKTAQLEEAINRIEVLSKQVWELSAKGTVLNDTEKAIVELKRLAENNPDNAYHNNNYENTLKKALEERWGVSLDNVQQQAYMKKVSGVTNKAPVYSMEQEQAKQQAMKEQALAAAMADARRRGF